MCGRCQARVTGTNLQSDDIENLGATVDGLELKDKLVSMITSHSLQM